MVTHWISYDTADKRRRRETRWRWPWQWFRRTGSADRTVRRRTVAPVRRSLWLLLFLPFLLLGGLALFLLIDSDDEASESKRAATRTEKPILTPNSNVAPEPVAAVMGENGRQLERNSSLSNLADIDLIRDASRPDLGGESCGDSDGVVVIEDGQLRIIDDLDPEMMKMLDQAGFSINNR